METTQQLCHRLGVYGQTEISPLEVEHLLKKQILPEGFIFRPRTLRYQAKVSGFSKSWHHGNQPVHPTLAARSRYGIMLQLLKIHQHLEIVQEYLLLELRNSGINWKEFPIPVHLEFSEEASELPPEFPKLPPNVRIVNGSEITGCYLTDLGLQKLYQSFALKIQNRELICRYGHLDLRLIKILHCSDIIGSLTRYQSEVARFIKTQLYQQVISRYIGINGGVAYQQVDLDTFLQVFAKSFYGGCLSIPMYHQEIHKIN